MLVSEMCRYKISFSLFIRFSKLISVAERKNKSFFFMIRYGFKTNNPVFFWRGTFFKRTWARGACQYRLERLPHVCHLKKEFPPPPPGFCPDARDGGVAQI